jgi:cytochrome c oxidase subunit 3
LVSLLLTIVLAILFTGFQAMEYSVSSFTITDGIYGSCFYFGTGFHGLHVIIGTVFLVVGMWRILLYHVTENHHLGFESAIFY